MGYGAGIWDHLVSMNRQVKHVVMDEHPDGMLIPFVDLGWSGEDPDRPVAPPPCHPTVGILAAPA